MGPSFSAAIQQMQQGTRKAAWMELRIDAMEEECVVHIDALLRASALPKILTFRRRKDGGRYAGDESARRQKMLQWARRLTERPDLYPDVYIDLEEDLDESFYCAIQDLFKRHAHIILSHHDTRQTPSLQELDQILLRMQAKKGAFYKIAVQSHRSVEALEFLDWAKGHVQAGVPLIPVSMGEEGESSRILSGILGFPFTYGFFEEREGSFHRLVDLYRIPFHTRNTAIYGLIGDPVTGSIGHLAHNLFFREQKIDAVYLKMRVREEELRDFFRYAAQLPVRGVSVTMPLKEKVLDYLDAADPFVERSGAANTLVFQNGKWWGGNTDGEAIVGAISRRTSVFQKKVLILGTGGVAKAAAWAAHAKGAFVDVMGREVGKARVFAEPLGGGVWDWDATDAWKKQDIILNCTPAPFPPHALLLPEKTLCLDLRIQSEEDPQLCAWQKKGGQVVHGKELFHRQAHLQRTIWFRSHSRNAGNRSIN